MLAAFRPTHGRVPSESTIRHALRRVNVVALEGQAPQALAALRNAVISLLRRAGWKNIAAGLRHYSASVQDALQFMGVPAPGL